ncbi:sugar phosphate isomerase/epimerase [Paenibacillus phyllosphaerae]|uniref:Sugar phosphate isomerase/epimerase n=1 Tax=Paenibacillus phyllosphaerae TaxID=274593 RepID=A0A7W5FRX8_9BACL|nr:sugar phosphate isomerase/epimerase [Paenibacillus phyllosphaerae]MBB3114762.1 sugar phosphate isomerase/epimerase [Paenibacillus phyllosphaerae]
MRKMGIGLQLFTLRNETAADFAGTLRKVAELGYEGVEFAGYGGLSAEELKALLEETGLKAIGAHVSLDNLRNNLQGEIDYLKTIGAGYIACPWVSPEERTLEDWKKNIAFWKETAAEVTKQGLVFGYHNHEFEFQESIDGQFVFDAIYAADPANIKVEMDVCWVKFAGQDPIAYINKYAGNLPLLHLKDFRKDEEGGMITLELGQGEVDLPAVVAAASEAGVQWLIVEQDNCQNPPLESVANSLNWVKQNYLALV